MNATRSLKNHWLGFALVTMLTWGVWGAFTGVTGEFGFPDTLVYVVWSLTMIPPALYTLSKAGWTLRRDPRSVCLGAAIGVLGAGGQMLLFHAVKVGPTYLIFPIISLSPVVTIGLSFLFLRERTGRLGLLGIALALISLPLFDYAPGGARDYGLWFLLALAVMVAWGIQGWVIKLANESMSAEDIFFWMAFWAVVSAPVAIAMTDFSQPINYGLKGPWLAALIQVLNAIGALTLVHAFRQGKAIVVSPMVNAGAPLLTALIAMALAGSLPGPTKAAAVALALLSALLLALQPEDKGAAA
jgi:uncharacterized membrane protein